MEKVVEFIGRHWELVAAFVVVLVIFILNEMRERIYGIPKVAPQNVTDLINHQEAIVLDLRDTNAYKDGHIIGAKNIPQKTVVDNLNKIEMYKTNPIILIDTHGQQSAITGKILRKHGFDKIVILAGGITAWRSENLPLVKK